MMVASTVRTWRDRWADWLVIGVVTVALLLGWVVKVWAVGGTDSFTDSETGLTFNYPAGWSPACPLVPAVSISSSTTRGWLTA